MSAYRRNLLVGLVVLGALIVLGWMILQFGGSVALPFAARQVPIHLVGDRADGVSDGSAVYYRGVSAGHVTTVTLLNNRQVQIDADINADSPLPENLTGIVRPNGLIGGGASVVLEVVGNGEPTGRLKSGATLPAEYSGLDLLPPQFADLAKQVTASARDLQDSHLFERVGKLADSLQQIAGDQKSQVDIRQTLQNLRDATEKANAVMTRMQQISTDTGSAINEARSTMAKADAQMETLGRQLTDRMQQTSRLLDQVNSIAEKVDTGKGTAGQLVNDPRLYESLVDTTKQLDETVKDMKRLVEQWEEEGVTLKLH